MHLMPLTSCGAVSSLQDTANLPALHIRYGSRTRTLTSGLPYRCIYIYIYIYKILNLKEEHDTKTSFDSNSN